jgi:hypothetical protein
MIPVVIINLPHRADRLEHIRKDWPDALVMPGVIHEMPHTGCGLAHIGAIRKGLESSPVCLVLEDDAQLVVPRAEVEEFVRTLTLGGWDVISLGTQHDNTDPEARHVSTLKFCRKDGMVQCEPTSRLVSTHACIWSVSALPLLEEYEDALKKGAFLPIDRLIFNNRWHPDDKSSWEPCLELALKGVKPPPLVWNVPRSWSTLQMMFVQQFGNLSDHTNKVNLDNTENNNELFRVFEGPSTEEPREANNLNVVFT